VLFTDILTILTSFAKPLSPASMMSIETNRYDRFWHETDMLQRSLHVRS
jgi:hypothetical protein